MKEKNCLDFDETAWSIIAQLLPDDEMVKRVVLDDFMWFINRSSNSKNNRRLIDAYIHHLELKANPAVSNYASHSCFYKNIDLERLRKFLLETYGE